jgi:hypothetical protein
MGNNIINLKADPGSLIELTNGSTDMVSDLLVLAGSAIAEDDHEKDLVIWIAQTDQHVRGRGAVSFDIAQIGWDPVIFEKQKDFMLRLISAAICKAGREKLDYEPLEPFASDTLKSLKEMITAFGSAHIDPKVQIDLWEFDEDTKKYERCSYHDVLYHAHGCIVCNNALS